MEEGFAEKRGVFTSNLVAETFPVETFPKHANRVDAGVTQTFVVWDRCKVPETNDFCPDADIRGHIDSIQRGAGQAFGILPPENATGNFVKVVQRVPVRIVLDEGQDPEHQLRPGMSVVAKVKIK